MVITHLVSWGGGGISKVGDEQFVFAKKIVGNSPWATQKLQLKKVHNREFIEIDTKHHWHNKLPNHLEKIIGHHAKFFRGACQRSFLTNFQECREEIQTHSHAKC
jgi:hypothetical protein